MKTSETMTQSDSRVSVKVTTLAIIATIVAAVALPQLFHTFGIITGLGTMPGETFLPMHLPILISGFLAGPVVGLIAGALAPAVSTALTGMPLPAMLPFMMIELAGYGLAAGLLKNVFGTGKYLILEVIAAQIAGRLIRAAAILVAVYGMGVQTVKPAMIWNSVLVGIPGLIIQLVAIPLVIYAVNNAVDKED